MRVHPAIAALRGAPVSQRQPLSSAAQPSPECLREQLRKVRDGWLAAPKTQNIARELSDYGAGANLKECPALARLVSSVETASETFDILMSAVLSALRESPLGEAPFGFSVSDGLTRMNVLEASGAVLSLSAYEPVDNEEMPDTALFSDRESHEIVLSGSARGVMHRIRDDHSLNSLCHVWRRGQTIVLNSPRETRQLLKVARSF